MTYTTTHIKQMPAPTVKKLLRERGHNFSTVARLLDRSHALISRVVRKQAVSEPVLRAIARILNDETAS